MPFTIFEQLTKVYYVCMDRLKLRFLNRLGKTK